MMIVPKSPSYSLQKFVDKLFTSYSTLLEYTYQQAKQNTLLFAVELLLTIVFDLSIILNN